MSLDDSQLSVHQGDTTQLRSYIPQLIDWGLRSSQRGWTRSGNCCYSLSLGPSPHPTLATLTCTCRSQLNETDFGLLPEDRPGSTPAAIQTPCHTALDKDLKIHAWIAQYHALNPHQPQANFIASTANRANSASTRPLLAILQSQSVWAELLADRFASLNGILLEDHYLLDFLQNDHQQTKVIGQVGRDTTRESKPPAKPKSYWLPIIPRASDTAKQISSIENRLPFLPSGCCSIGAFLIQRHGLFVWDNSLLSTMGKLEALEYLFESIMRKASLG